MKETIHTKTRALSYTLFKYVHLKKNITVVNPEPQTTSGNVTDKYTGPFIFL